MNVAIRKVITGMRRLRRLILTNTASARFIQSANKRMLRVRCHSAVVASSALAIVANVTRELRKVGANAWIVQFTHIESRIARQA